MNSLLYQFLVEDQGQDLIEYSLLLTFVLFAVLGIFNGYHNSVAGITTTTSQNLDTANTFIR